MPPGAGPATPPGGWRMVVTDLDGTILRPDLTYSTRTAALMAKLRGAGLHTVVATARPPRERFLIRRLGIDFSHMILANGAYVLDSAIGRVLRDAPLPDAALDQVVVALKWRYPGAVFTAETVDGMVSERGFAPYGVGAEGPWTDRMRATVAGTTYKLLCRHRDLRPDRITEVADCLAGLGVSLTCSAPAGLIEVMAGGTDKGSALVDLCDILGVCRGGVIGFGDMLNDLPMLRQCGLSVAVENAHAEVIAAADLLTGECQRDGVAVFLEQLCGHRRTER